MCNYVTGEILSEKKAYMDYRLRTTSTKSLRNCLRSVGTLNITSSVITTSNIGGQNEIKSHFADVSTPESNYERLDLLCKYESVFPESHLGRYTFSSVSADKVLTIITTIV